MNKPTIIASSLLAIIVTIGGYFVWSGEKKDVANWCPIGRPTAVDTVNVEKTPELDRAIEYIDATCTVNGHRITR